jgi:F-type H+-transporting ATPase subunit delta
VSSNEKGLAGRYAGALYDLTVEAKSTDAVTADLTAVKSLISENDDMAMLVSSPAYSRVEQSKAAQAVLTAAKANPLTVKFVGAVAENGRLFALPQIIQAFIDEVARRNGQVSAEVVSAVALDAKRQESVEETVSQIAGSKNISLSLRVDPSLIGGLVVRIGSRLIDTSLKTKLNRLEAAMKGVA